MPSIPKRRTRFKVAIKKTSTSVFRTFVFNVDFQNLKKYLSLILGWNPYLCYSDFCLAFLTRRASLSDLIRSFSYYSALSLDSSTRRAYYSASSRACSSSFSAIRLASRARITPSSTFSRERLCYSAVVMGSDVCVSLKFRVLQ